MALRTPIKAIRAKCIDCCAGQMYEVSKCTIKKCPLWEYRMGRRPKGDNLLTENELDREVDSYVGTDEQKEATNEMP